MHHPTRLALCGLLILFIVLPPATGLAGFSLFSRHKAVSPSQDQVRIPLERINDDKAHYYKYQQAGTAIRFFVVRSRDGVIRAAFDACDVCFPAAKGYTKEGDFMTCVNCGQKFHTSRINVERGGCNPAPLRRRLEGAELVIDSRDIAAGNRFFRSRR
ncbi:DUF2318 domain-containing protein [Desulfogranum mediterraneum]|uniref:DUF2318 domain-containing protein n=1 Tax=Desulfogranum mediterraneum TaxID=160661 RepID=UPI0003F8DFFC|nr:DUF2318 domain-containing protein [Desulfogranum mediterraneum]